MCHASPEGLVRLRLGFRLVLVLLLGCSKKSAINICPKLWAAPSRLRFLGLALHVGYCSRGRAEWNIKVMGQRIRSPKSKGDSTPHSLPEVTGLG